MESISNDVEDLIIEQQSLFWDEVFNSMQKYLDIVQGMLTNGQNDEYYELVQAGCYQAAEIILELTLLVDFDEYEHNKLKAQKYLKHKLEIIKEQLNEFVDNYEAEGKFKQ